MLRVLSSRLSKADYLRLLREAPMPRPAQLMAPLHGSALAGWTLGPGEAAVLRAPPAWQAAAQAALDASLGGVLGRRSAPEVFLRTLIHPSFVGKPHQGRLAMPAEMTYMGRSLLLLHAEALALVAPGQRPPLHATAASVAVAAGLDAVVLYRREFFAMNAASPHVVPAEVLVAAGASLVGAVSTIYGPSTAAKLLEALCPLPGA